jgi:hypothetical protein
MWFSVSFFVLLVFLVLGTQSLIYSGAFFGLYPLYTLNEDQDRPLTKDRWLGFIALMAGLGCLGLSYITFLLSGVYK